MHLHMHLFAELCPSRRFLTRLIAKVQGTRPLDTHPTAERIASELGSLWRASFSATSILRNGTGPIDPEKSIFFFTHGCDLALGRTDAERKAAEYELFSTFILSHCPTLADFLTDEPPARWLDLTSTLGSSLPRKPEARTLASTRFPTWEMARDIERCLKMQANTKTPSHPPSPVQPTTCKG